MWIFNEEEENVPGRQGGVRVPQHRCPELSRCVFRTYYAISFTSLPSSAILKYMQRSRKNSQPFVFQPDGIGGFMSNELAMYSGLFWNRKAFSFRSRLPKLVPILLPLISLDFRCYASKVQLNKQPTFQVLWMTIEEILCAFSFAKTRMESLEIFSR